MEFRERLIATLRAAQPVLDVPGVLVAGSEVPNLLERGAAASLVVSEDVDLAIPVAQRELVKAQLDSLRGLRPSKDEPSVWVPEDPAAMIELNFVGRDEDVRTADETYFLEDSRLPLIVFGPLSLLEPGEVLEIEGVRVPLPHPSGLMLEKLVSDRTAEKGDRDLLVVLGLLLVCDDAVLDRTERTYRQLSEELQHIVRTNLALLSLARPREGMPDPSSHRDMVAALLRRFEGTG